ncbi:MAG TPA: hypothetical protein VE291_09700 [Terracidiphilus sp.]|jgi:hypothetical protein|nr:hypothetical protein [Terracidiphilus sp.]
MKVWIALPLLLLSSIGAFAQVTLPSKKVSSAPVKTTSKPSLKPATVSGFVFALTKGGDVKPARMANVYMLYSRPAQESAAQIVAKSPSTTFAADVFRKESLDGEQRGNDWEKDKTYSDSLRCHKTLNEASRGAILKTLNWGKDHISQFVIGDTDEEGRFELTLPPDYEDATFEPSPHGSTAFAPGIYLVVVIGSAGYNDALWEDEVTVIPGQVVKVKMSEPAMACLKMDSE